MSIFKRRSGKRAGTRQRDNFGKAMLYRKSQERLLASPENLNDPVARSVLEALPLSSPHILEDDSWKNPVDTLLWCGENLKMALLEYITEEGILGVRLIFFLSFKKTSKGDILIYAMSQKHNPEKLRSYRLDRVVTITPTIISGTPPVGQQIELFF